MGPIRNLFKFFILALVGLKMATASYEEFRASLIEKDRSKALGYTLPLSSKEQTANKLVMSLKQKEYDDGFENPGNFLPAQHFFKSKSKIEQSEVFKIIKKMPKGASLHCHDTSLVSPDFLFNLTYKDNLYGCWQDGLFLMHFFNESSVGDDCDWKLLSDLRSANASFDDYLRSQLTLVVDDPDTTYPDINKVWEKFRELFETVDGLLNFVPVWNEYFYEVLKELYEDNVMYVEFRGTLHDMYDLEGNIYSDVQVVEIIYQSVQQFLEDYPDFHGVRFIYTPNRKVETQTVDEYMEICLKLKEAFPDFVAGFDLEGQEDLGRPLIDFLPQLKEMKNNGIRFFFHSGETNWNGQPTDLNLFDAILLNTTRIGHGYAIVKHPVIMEMVKKHQIAVEISPISNQVLKLVEDIRNHPAAILIANDYPVVITADDPSFWGAYGLSYDWYYAFMGIANREDDLRFLKQLGINSIKFSVMEESEREMALEKLCVQWNIFVNQLLVN